MTTRIRTQNIDPEFHPENSPSALNYIGAIEKSAGRNAIDYDGHDEQVSTAHTRKEGRKSIAAAVAVVAGFVAVGAVAHPAGAAERAHSMAPAPLTAQPHHHQSAPRQ